MVHQFILDHIEIILAVIVIAQGIILYGQSQIYKWCQGVFAEILEFMDASNSIFISHSDKINKIKDKIK